MKKLLLTSLVAILASGGAYAANVAESGVLTSKYYVDSGLEQKANKADITDMATQAWVEQQGYVTNADLNLDGYVTQQELEAAGYLVESDLQPVWTNLTQIEEDAAASDLYFREEIRKNSELDATIRDLIVNQTDANGDGVRDGEVYVVRDRLDKLEASESTKQDAIDCDPGQIIQYDAAGNPGCATVVAGPYTGN